MNTGAFGEGFPYTNFHDLNLNWIIKIAKDFLDQYTTIQNVISTGMTDLDNETQEGLASLQAKATDLETVLGQLEQQYISQFNQSAENKAQQTIASIPDDYTTFFNEAIRTIDAYTTYASFPSDYRNANNLPVNTVIGIKFGMTSEQIATTSNYPYAGFAGEVLTINSTKSNQSFGFQLAVSETNPVTDSTHANKVYFRSRFTNWTDWQQINSIEEIRALLESTTITVYDAYTTYAGLPTAYRNANNLPVNSVIGYKFGMTDEQQATMSNFPLMPFSGEILTINSTKSNASFGWQLAISEANPTSGMHDRVFFRSKFTYYSSWVEISNLTYFNNAYRGLGNFVACGDSLTVSYAYTDETHYIQVKSWAEHLASMMGSECVVKAQGGITAGGFLSSSLMTDAEADTSDFAIVYLGTNDANQGTDASTFKTNYETIVGRLKTNHEVVFCVPLAPATSPSTRETYNAKIKEVCEETSGAWYLDMTTLQNQFSAFVRQGHLNRLGYSAFANAIAQAISFIIAQHPLMVV